MLMRRHHGGGRLPVPAPPPHPGEGFPAHVRRGSGAAEGEPLIPVPLPGRRGAESVSHDRFAAAEFVAGLRSVRRGGVPRRTGRRAGHPRRWLQREQRS